MNPTEYFAASRLLIVAGKGGVGKTVVTAALARAASLVGRSALVIEVEGKSGLPRMFGRTDPEERGRMTRAFRRSAEWELAFFRMPTAAAAPAPAPAPQGAEFSA